MTATPLTPDLCVIGGGWSGVTRAIAAAEAGQSVVLIDRDELGRRSRHQHRLAARALIASAAGAQAMRAVGAVALFPVEPRLVWAEVRARAEAVVAATASDRNALRLRALGITVLGATARFADAKTVEAGGSIVRARRFVLATGAAPTAPVIPGLESVRWLTSEHLLDLDTLPSHLIVVGAGAEGLACAQAFRRLGSLVTVIGTGDALPEAEREMAGAVLGSLSAEGVVIRTGVAPRAIEPGWGGTVRLSVDCDGKTEWFSGSHLLAAVGQSPRVENLGLDRAGVQFSGQGIEVRDDGRTTSRRVFAAGAVATGTRETRARLAVNPSPLVAHTAPEFATVGLGEAAARQAHKRIRIGRASIGATDRARSDGVGGGHIKVIATPEGRVLGASIVGPQAAELLTPWTLAVAGKLTIADLATAAVPALTFTEASRDAALAIAPARERTSTRGRLARMLRPFG